MPHLGVPSNTNKILRPVCKPHSVQWLAPSVQSSIWAACHHAARCSIPGTQMRRAASCSCFALLPTGVTWPFTLLQMPVVSYTTISPSPPEGGCLFLWPSSGRLTPPRRLSDVVLCGVRTFLEPACAEPRLPDQPERFHHTRAPHARQQPNSGHFGKRH